MKSISQLLASTAIHFLDGLREVAKEEQEPYEIVGAESITTQLLRESTQNAPGTQIVFYVNDYGWRWYSYWTQQSDERKWTGWERDRNECVFIEKFPEPRGVWRLVFEVRAIQKSQPHPLPDGTVL